MAATDTWQQFLSISGLGKLMISFSTVILFLVVVMVSGIVTSFAANNKVGLASIISVLAWLGLVIGFVIFQGIGHTWNTYSAMLKIVALGIAVGLPFLLIVVPFVVGRSYNTSSLVRGVIGLAAGVIAVILFPWLRILIACSLTGDCV